MNNNEEFVCLTSTYDTPLFIRKELIVVVEGFTFAPDHSQKPNHTGSRITVMTGQWSETMYCLQGPATVVGYLSK